MNLLISITIFMSICFFSCSDSNSTDEYVEEAYQPLTKEEIESSILYIDSLPKLLPVDESWMNDSFLEFRTLLLNALEMHDSAFVYTMLDSNILNSFGGDGGIEEFKAKWKIEDNASPFWSLFMSLIELGGTFSEDTLTYSFPYIFDTFPNNLDPYYHRAIKKDQGNVYLSTSENSIFHSTSYSIFEILEWEDINLEIDELYIPVVVDNKRYGFVKATDIHSPIGYRGIFIFKQNTWKLDAFIAGD